MPSLPKSNVGATIGAALTSILLYVAQAIVDASMAGRSLPESLDDWQRFLIPAIAGGVLAWLMPRGSITEMRTGYRVVTPPPAGSDAPVVNKPPNT